MKVVTLPRQRGYSRVTLQALTMIGKLVRVGRAERGLTARELADSAGIFAISVAGIGAADIALKS